jgi:HK97 family phage prohead protease
MADRPKPGAIEQRQAPDTTVDGKRLRGVIPYGVESRDMGGWTEIVEPTALRGAKLDDLVATVDHAGIPIGRYPTTLELEDRDDGAHWSVTLPESRSDVREAVERGDLRAGSWRMRVAEDRWDGDVRHVVRIAELRDVSVVTAPAYPAAVTEYRSTTNPGEAQEDTMGDKPEQDKQDEQRTQETTTEDRSERIPAGSLRVEERTEAPLFQSLSEAFAQGGFFENRSAAIGYDEFRTVVWGGGTVLTDLNPIRQGQPALGYDQRWLYPVLPTTAVSDSTTAVQYVRQSARTLAGTAVVRPLDSVSAKPDVSSTVEYTSTQLSQVAAISKDVPRILSNQPIFQSIVESDLRLSINDGLDEVARRGISTAGTAAAVTGTDVLQKVRKAMTVIQSNGYNPTVLAIDPAGAEALDLLQSSGSEKFYLWGPGRAAPTGPFGLTMRVWKTAGTALLDSTAFGQMYISPIELRSFEQDAGSTNRQTYRMETNAAYTVERVTAGLRII